MGLKLQVLPPSGNYNHLVENLTFRPDLDTQKQIAITQHIRYSYEKVIVVVAALPKSEGAIWDMASQVIGTLVH
jgi:hypothetical protein